MAAHTKYTKELVDTVLQELAVGKSIREALKTVDVSWEIWRQWLNKKTGLRELYSIAKEDGIEYSMADVDQVAKDAVKKSANSKMDMANVKAIDTFIKHKQWMASKLAARRYGDRQSLEIGNMKDQAFSIKWDKQEDIMEFMKDKWNNLNKRGKIIVGVVAVIVVVALVQYLQVNRDVFVYFMLQIRVFSRQDIVWID